MSASRAAGALGGAALALSPIVLASGLGLVASAPLEAARPGAAARQSGGASGGVGLAVVGQVGGGVQAVAVAGARATFGMGTRVVVADVTDASEPVVLGASAPLPGPVADVAVAGSVAYVAYGNLTGFERTAGTWGAVQLFDVSRPEQPVALGRWAPPRGAVNAPVGALAVRDGLMVVAAGSAGLRVVDVRDPSRPREIGVAEVGWAVDLALSGDLAYVAADSGLHIVDLSRPEQPRVIHTIGLGEATAVAAGTDVVAVAVNDAGITWILDARDPRAPEVVDALHAGGPTVLAAAGRTLLICGQNQLTVIPDAADLGSGGSFEGGFAFVPGFALDVVTSGERAYLAMNDGGLRIVDFADPAVPIDMGAIVGPYGAAAASVARGHLFVADGETGVQILTLDDPRAPRKVAAYPAHGANALAVDGPVAYVGNRTSEFGLGQGLRVVDVSAPARPREVASLFTVFAVEAVAAISDTVFASTAFEELSVVDVRRPDAPVVVGTIVSDRHAPPQAMAVRAPYLYAASATGLQILDVSLPRAPVEVGGWFIEQGSAFGALDVATDGEIAVLAGGETGLRVVDVRVPQNPVEVGRLLAGGVVRAVALSGRRAFAVVNRGRGDDTPRLLVVDLADPRRPRVAASWTMPEARGLEFNPESFQPFVDVDVAVEGDLVYFGAPFVGLYVLRLFEGPRVFLPVMGG